MVLWAVTFAQGGATIAMLVSSSVYFVNDIIAFTVSPWFNMGRRKMGLKEIKQLYITLTKPYEYLFVGFL